MWGRFSSPIRSALVSSLGSPLDSDQRLSVSPRLSALVERMAEDLPIMSHFGRCKEDIGWMYVRLFFLFSELESTGHAALNGLPLAESGKQPSEEI